MLNKSEKRSHACAHGAQCHESSNGSCFILAATDMSVNKIQAHKVKARGHQSQQTWRPFYRLISMHLAKHHHFAWIIHSIGLLNTKLKCKVRKEKEPCLYTPPHCQHQEGSKLPCLKQIHMNSGQIQAHKIKSQGHQSEQTWKNATLSHSFACIIQSTSLMYKERKTRHKCERKEEKKPRSCT